MTTNKEQVVPCFSGVEALCDALEKKGTGAAIDLYPRDGTSNLYELEAQVAELSGNSHGHTITYNSGMSAITDAVEVGIERSTRERPVIAYAAEAYSKTISYVGRYASRHRLETIPFDSGDRDEVAQVVEERRPDIIISETVSNGPNMPVLDHENLLESVSRAQLPATLILDHTLPLSSGYRLLDDIAEEDGVMVVESGTKSYGLNTDILGIIFCKNDSIREKLLKLRCERGSLPSVGGTEKLLGALPKTREDFDKRNLTIYENTTKVALEIGGFAVSEGLPFLVHHPALPTHRNSGYANDKNGGNIAPVVYIQPKDSRQIDFAKKLEGNPDLTEIVQFGQSFGFDHTRILPDIIAPFVRIAPGAKIEVEELIRQLKASVA